MRVCIREVQTVGLSPAETTALGEAVRTLWPEARLSSTASVEEALRRPGQPGRELLVLGERVAPREGQRSAAALAGDGSPRWPVVVLGPGAVEEHVWHVMPGARDATALARTLEVAAAQHAAWREAVRARGDLQTIARCINHELRSPLGYILTSTEILKEELAHALPSATSLVEPLAECARDAISLVERFAQLARASAVLPAPESLELGAVVSSACERLAPRIAAVGAEIDQSDTWPAVLGVESWLESIWRELIGNALRHGGTGLRIELGWERAEEGEVRCFVRDDGNGVPQSVVPGLFRPFHRLHESDSAKGLGHAVVQRLVELQGGRCGHAPVLPHGACFFFTVPQASPSVAG